MNSQRAYIHMVFVIRTFYVLCVCVCRKRKFHNEFTKFWNRKTFEYIYI
jgi:hypothetical protein